MLLLLLNGGTAIGFVLHSGAPTVVTPPVTTDIKVTLTANRGTHVRGAGLNCSPIPTHPHLGSLAPRSR